jgi:hypothetical protein
MHLSPLCRAAIERVVERSKDRVSKSIRVALMQIRGAQVTHPECATLFDPLSGKPERG